MTLLIGQGFLVPIFRLLAMDNSCDTTRKTHNFLGRQYPR